MNFNVCFESTAWRANNYRILCVVVLCRFSGFKGFESPSSPEEERFLVSDKLNVES